jgi:putative membrane protein insertion efficiency factor
MMARLLQSLIRFYKKAFSQALLSTCRYTPTCSDYAMEALERHGAIVGLSLAVWRTLRCNPFSRGGLDTVPTKLHTQDVRTHNCRQAHTEKSQG